MTGRNVQPAVGRHPYRMYLEPNEMCITDIETSVIEQCTNPETERSLTLAMSDPNALVRVYRALPQPILDLNNGDFIGLTWATAAEHKDNCESRQGQKFHIITTLVEAKQVFLGEHGPFHFGYLGDDVVCDIHTSGTVGNPFTGQPIEVGNWVSVNSGDDGGGRFWAKALEVTSSTVLLPVGPSAVSFPIDRVTHMESRL